MRPPIAEPLRKIIPISPVTYFTAPETGRTFNDFLLVAIIGLIAVLPLWIPTFPAMCDAPQHASQVAILRQLDHPGFAYSQLFFRHTQIPNLLGYGLLYYLGPLMGLVAACKLIVSASLLGFLLASSWLLREFDSDPRLALLAVPGLYGFPFLWGFLGFLASVPLGICFLVLALRYFRAPSLLRGICLAFGWLVVFFCHALVAAAVAAAAVVCALVGLRSARQFTRGLLPIIAPMLPAGLWWLHSIANLAHSHKSMEWNLGWGRFPKFFEDIIGVPSGPIALLLVIAFIAPVAGLIGMRRHWRYYSLFAVSIVAALLFPQSIFGVESPYQRFAPLALIFFALTLAPATQLGLQNVSSPETLQVSPRRANLAVAWMVVVALAWTGGMAWRMTVFQREARGWSTLLRQMAPGQRVLSINFERESNVFSGAVFLHFPVWYSALKSGIVDPSFACGNVDLVLYRPEAMPKIRFADFEFHPERFNWQQHEGPRYRYFVIHSPAERGAKLFADSESPVVLRVHDGDWWLYENTAESLSPSVHR